MVASWLEINPPDSSFPTLLGRYGRPSSNLDPRSRFAHASAMGKQYNKAIKKRRRLRYWKRKKENKKAGTATKSSAG